MDERLRNLLDDPDEAAPEASEPQIRATFPQSSVRLDRDRCVGCGACMRACPTEAIRIRKGKAFIRSRLCIDCGECVRVCEHKAGVVLADPFSSIEPFAYRIAVPEASLYGQFLPNVHPDEILAGLLDLGFQEVYEASMATERVGLLLKEYLARYQGPRPLMSSFCPVVVRLVQLKFPDVIELVVLVDSVMELAVKELKEKRSGELGIPVEKIGAFYIAGCPARITTIHHPYTGGKTHLDGAISIDEIYRDLMFAIRRRQREGGQGVGLRRSTGSGIRWGALGGEIEALGLDNTIAVSDTKHLVRVIEEIDNNKLSDVHFVECRACYGGCAGGPLMVDNVYRGRAKIQMLSRIFGQPGAEGEAWAKENFDRHKHYWDRRLAPLPSERLDPDPARAIEKMAQKADILQSLPGIDCGSCGAPNCRALADDIVRGEANVMYCIFKLRDEFLRQKKHMGKKPVSNKDVLP